MEIYVMCGIPGSGKSTWIKNNLPKDILIISRDLIRATIGISESGDHKAIGTPEQERLVTDLENEAIENACLGYTSFVIDDINTGKYRKNLIERLRKCAPDAEIIGVNIKTNLEKCIERRKDQIKPSIMQRIADRIVYIQLSEVDKVLTFENWY